MVNKSVLVFAGEPIILPVDIPTRYIKVTIDCGPLIDQVVNTSGITNSTVTWYFNDFLLTTGSAINIEISNDGTFCIITNTLLDLFGTGGNYSCVVCSASINCKRNDTCFAVCGKYS